MDLHQPFGIRYASYPLVLDVFISLAYWKGLIYGVIQYVVVHPKPQEVSLHNKIGNHTKEVPYFSLGSRGTMCLIFLTCSMFLPVSVLHLVVCSSIDTPLEWFDPWPIFYHFLLYIRRFLAKSLIHMHFLAKICIYTQGFGQKSRIHASFQPKFPYIC